MTRLMLRKVLSTLAVVVGMIVLTFLVFLATVFLVVSLSRQAEGQVLVTEPGGAVIQGQVIIPAPITTPPPIGTQLFTLEEHNISDPAAYPTIPFGLYREYGTSCQWNNMWTGTGDNYNFTCFGQQIAYAHSLGVPLMFTFGQVPSGLSTINPDNMTGAPAQFPVAINGVALNCGSGTCSATVTTLQRLNATAGTTPGVTLTGATGCPENPNGTFILTAANNPTNYPGWTYTFNIGAGSVSSTACGGPVMFLADNSQTATRCGGTGSAVGGQNGGCYSPNDVNIDGTGTDAHLISFLTQLLAYDAANDPTHTLIYIEAWNEPQGPGFFNGSIAQMARMMKDMFTVIQGSAQATYLQLASTAPSGGLTSPASYLGLLGADPSNPFQYVCCIDNHTYNYPPGAGTPDPMSAITIAANVRAAIAPFTSAVGKPQLATEGSWGFGPFGASTTNLGPNTGTVATGDKAGWVADAYVAHQCAGYKVYSFFAWDQACHTGLACATPPPPYSIDPAGIAYGIAHDWLVGATVSQSCSKDPSGNWTLNLQRSGWNGFIVFNTGLTTVGSYPITAGVYTQYRDIFGNVNPIASNQTSVPVQFDPILVETGPPPFFISSSPSLPPATVGILYSATLTAPSTAAGPYTWKEVTLPPVITAQGLTLASATSTTATISGNPLNVGTFQTQVRVMDVNGQTYAQNLSWTVNPSNLMLVNFSPPGGTTGVLYGATGTGYTFSATGGVACGTPSGYNWVVSTGSVPGLTINGGSGVYGNGQMPTTPGTYVIQVTASDCNTPTPNSKTTPNITIIINAGVGPLQVISGPCPSQGFIGQPYLCQNQAQGGVTPYVWAVQSGTIPHNLTYSTISNVGTLQGMPDTVQSVCVQFKVTDHAGTVVFTPATGCFPISIVNLTANADNIYTPFSGGICNPTYGATADASALTPTRCQNSQRINRLSPGATITVPGGANLQQYLTGPTHTVACGETLLLTAGSTYTGQFTPPAGLNCDVNHWITLDTTDTTLMPPEGVRNTPCQDGIASLPNRPAYSCPVAIAAMPRIATTASGGGAAFHLDTNTSNFWQFKHIVFVNACPSPCTLSNLVTMGTAHDIVFDQVIAHGPEAPTLPVTASSQATETNRFVGFGQGKNIMVVDGYYYDFYSISNIPGLSGNDTQCWSGGTGSTLGTLWGNYKIVNNFCEAAGENIEMGGGGGPGPNPCQPSCIDDSPTDGEVRLNHFYKNPTWIPTKGTTLGTGWPVVKNLFECKNCERFFLEANIMEWTWPGFTQNGVGVLLTPKSQSNACPNCSVTDVIYRYNYISHVVDGFQFANGASDAGGFAFQGMRYSFHDNVVDDMLNTTICWGPSSQCTGAIELQMSSQVTLSETSDRLNSINFAHNTLVLNSSPQVQPTAAIGLSGPQASTGFQSFNVQYLNNAVPQGLSGTSNVTGSSSSCAAPGIAAAGSASFASCLGPNPPSQLGGNAFLTGTAIWAPLPSTLTPNCTSETAASIFVNYNGGTGFLNGTTNYQIKSTSPCFSQTTDGKPPGADVSGLLTKVSGVQ